MRLRWVWGKLERVEGSVVAGLSAMNSELDLRAIPVEMPGSLERHFVFEAPVKIYNSGLAGKSAIEYS
jgi:hypothetical protein